MPGSSKVVKLAQPGYDVKTAGDENLIYNSNWPLLKIFKQGSFSVTDTGSAINPVFYHNLGYVPAYLWFSNNEIADWIVPTGKQDRRSEVDGPSSGGFEPTINETKLTLDLNVGFFTGKFQFYYYIFALDITKAYTAPQIKVGGTQGGGGSKVFKLAKEGKSIDSNNLEDYVVHSDARSPLVHAVYPGIAKPNGSVGGFGFTFYHNLGYIPMIFTYLLNPQFITNGTPNTWQLLSPDVGGGGSRSFTIDEQKIEYTGLNLNEQVSLVVLKDPFNIDYSVSVAV